MTYHRELCLFPAIIQIAFGDVNSSRLINHAPWDGLTLRMSNVFASPPKGAFFVCLGIKLAKNLSPHFISYHFQDVTSGRKCIEKLFFLLESFFYFECILLLHLGVEASGEAWHDSRSSTTSHNCPTQVNPRVSRSWDLVKVLCCSLSTRF